MTGCQQKQLTPPLEFFRFVLVSPGFMYLDILKWKADHIIFPIEIIWWFIFASRIKVLTDACLALDLTCKSLPQLKKKKNTGNKDVVDRTMAPICLHPNS